MSVCETRFKFQNFAFRRTRISWTGSLIGKNILYWDEPKSLDYDVQWSIGICLADIRTKKCSFLEKIDFWVEKFLVFCWLGHVPLTKFFSNFNHLKGHLMRSSFKKNSVYNVRLDFFSNFTKSVTKPKFAEFWRFCKF